MPKVTPFLWFDDNAEDAARFYTDVFPDASITHVQQSGPAGPGDDDSVLLVSLVIQGQELTFLNGGPSQRLSEAFSLMVDCADQAEVDRYWSALLADGGQEHVCGWLKDRFGLSWQIVPRALMELMGDPDPVKSSAVMAAMMDMVKLDVAGLQAAYDGA